MKKSIIVLILGALLMTGLNLNMVAFSAGNDNSIIAPCWENTSSVHGHLTVDGTDGNLTVGFEAVKGMTFLNGLQKLPLRLRFTTKTLPTVGSRPAARGNIRVTRTILP